MLPEFTILMLTLLNEGSICQESELRAIARTIQVRAEERKMTIRQVCLQKNQFSCWNGRKNKKKILKAYQGGQYQGTPAWKRCQRVAQELYDGKLEGMPRWNHYYLKAMKNKPVWSKDMEQKRAYKHHLFGRIGK